ncbi:hypothetical protein TRFO_37822 [Tritrichomonas foetus]|uniref:Uncharacterized protein n=1 Tax=Tritrichomonas foetus TaxID=1144522 RepID=A0A1J4JA52_9EUKA|nr:hypothetical protein TRFO_37822 [Tritrichomonas foetus]|eukprot:OHS96066.1 hypothetical protein TRFO_37822 [Tritrichomonas foetus]
MSRRTPSNSQAYGYSPHVVPHHTSLLIDSHPEPVSVKAKQRPITKDDINELKIERQKLIDERTQLKTKIARLEVQSKRSARTSNANPQLLSQLDREYKTVEHLIMQQRAQINELLMSDNAAQRQELQEEAKIIFMERTRLMDMQLQQQISLNEAKKELSELLANDGPTVYEKQANRINSLEAKLKKYLSANEKLTSKVKTLKSKKALEEEAATGTIGTRANQIRAQIRDAERATEDIEEKIAKSIQKHKEVMKSLQISLIQKDLDAPEK